MYVLLVDDEVIHGTSIPSNFPSMKTNEEMTRDKIPAAAAFVPEGNPSHSDRPGSSR